MTDRWDNQSAILGKNNSNNGISTSAVTANADGSILERLESIASLAATVTSLGALGTQVSRAAAEIFDGTTTPLFTVAGGRVIVTLVTMQNSVAACDATADNVQIIANPTTGTSTPMCAVLDVADDEINTLYGITGTPADAMVQSGAANSGMVPTQAVSQVIDVGTIDLSSSGDSGAGGTDVQTSVDLWYFPLDTGATVVTA